MDKDNRRKHFRIKFEVQCFLTGHGGDTYKALLDDISLSGASLKVEADTRFQTGDTCDLLLSDKSTAFPVKHTCKVVRVDSELIGVNFLN